MHRLPAPAAHYLLPFGARSRFLFKMDFAENSQKASTRTGLGIQWEMVRALQLLAHSEGTSAEDKTRLLEQALSAAKTIHREPGEYEQAAETMIERLQAELDEK